MLRGGLQWMTEDRMKRFIMNDSPVQVLQALMVGDM